MRHLTVSAALVALLGSMLASAPASAASTAPTVRLSGELVQVADQQGTGSAALRMSDNTLVPINALSVKNIKSGSSLVLDVLVPRVVQTAAAANQTLRRHSPDGKENVVPLRSGDLAAASDGSPASPSSAIGTATLAEAMAPGTPALTVAAVVTASADPVSTYSPATRQIYVAVVTPFGATAQKTFEPARIRAQVVAASVYWSEVSGTGLKLAVESISTQYTSANKCGGDDPFPMWNEAVKKTGFAFEPNTSLVLELPPGISGLPDSDCSYGMGTIGANPNDSGMLYVADDVWPVLAHELGHNMSLQHANSLRCTTADSAFSGTGSPTSPGIWTGAGCKEQGYGDGQDIMSASPPNFAPFLSTPQSLRTGIIPPGAATIIDAPGTQTVTLQPLVGRAGVRAAEVVNPATGVTYYVEHRPPVGRDSLNVFGAATGVRVLRLNPVSGTTVVLDPTPSAATRDPDSTLPAHMTFTSYDGGVSITTLSQGSTQAVVSISVSKPTAPGGFTGKAPVRVLDTRYGTGGAKAKLGAGGTRTLTVPGLPAGTTAVALNVTVTGPTAASYLSVYPAGQARVGSNLNYLPKQTIPNMVVVPLGPGNTVTFYNSAGTVDVIADLLGYFAN